MPKGMSRSWFSNSETALVQNAEVNQHLHDDVGINPGAQIVEHDAAASGQFFQLPQRRWLQDIESPKKYKTPQNILPTQGHSDERDELAGNLINHHLAGVGDAAFTAHDRRDRYADHADFAAAHPRPPPV